MNKIPQKIYWVPIILLLFLSIWVIINSPAKLSNAPAVRGRIDLSSLDSRSIVGLTGEWQYYKGVLSKDISSVKTEEYIQIPYYVKRKAGANQKSNNVATYELTISGLAPDELYGVQILSEVCAYRLLVNGKEILNAGKVADQKEEYSPEMKAKIGHFYADGNGQAILMMEIANFNYPVSGFWKEIKLGKDQLLCNYADHQERVEIYLFASTLLLGVLILCLYSISREISSLFYFAMICLLVTVRVLVTNNRLIYDVIYPMSWDLGTRLEYISGYLFFPIFCLFFNSLDYIKKNKYLIYLFYTYMIVISCVVIITPINIYAGFLNIYLDLSVISFAYYLYILIQGIRYKKPGALLLMIGILGLIPTVLIDFYGNLNYDLLPFGIYFMLICFSIVVITNVLKIKKQNDYLEKAILKDPLTGLKNRYFLNKLMDQGYPISDNNKLYILFIDLDKFKYINDKYGHTVGDDILKESANRIQSCFRRDEDIVVRYGGDEFIAFTTVRKEDDMVLQIIDRILHSFEEPIIILGVKHQVSVSIGASEYYEGNDLGKVINESDKAMYLAKKSSSGKILIVDGQVRTN